MKKFIIGFILGAILFGGISYATRLEQSPTFYDLTNPNEIANLNLELEKIRNILNGRYSFDIESTLRTTGNEGDSYIYVSGSTRRFYQYVDGAWRWIGYDG